MCECPVVRGMKFVGDGYTHCEGKSFSIELHCGAMVGNHGHIFIARL